MEAALMLSSGRNQGTETSLCEGVYLIGRSPKCQIRPKNKMVSRKHCAIINTRAQLAVRDVGSKHGTYVNGQRVPGDRSIPLADGDRLQVGKTRFSVVFKEAVESKPVRSNRKSTPQKPSGRREPTSEEILALLEDDDTDAESVATHFQLGRGDSAGDSEIDLEAESDNEVDFAAPNSADSLKPGVEVPSYRLRQDWDVQSVHQWVASEEARKPAKPNVRKFKLKSKKAPRAPNSTHTPKATSGLSILGIDADSLPKVAVGLGAMALLSWGIWSAYQVASFQDTGGKHGWDEVAGPPE